MHPLRLIDRLGAQRVFLKRAAKYRSQVHRVAPVVAGKVGASPPEGYLAFAVKHLLCVGLEVPVLRSFIGFKPLKVDPSVGENTGVARVRSEGVVVPFRAASVGIVEVDGPFVAFGLVLALEPQGAVAVIGAAVAGASLHGIELYCGGTVLIGRTVGLATLVLV